MRLTDDCQYEPEEEKQKENQQVSKKSDKKEPPKKSTKYDWIKFNKWINEKGTGTNSEIFKKHFR